MPTTNSHDLTLTTVDENVTINVKYNAVFTPFERHLVEHGLQFYERITVIGADPPGSTTGDVLHTFPNAQLPVTRVHKPEPPEPQTIPRDVSITVSRDSLQEDVSVGNADEIRCRIELRAIGIPPDVYTTYTDEKVLLG